MDNTLERVAKLESTIAEMVRVLDGSKDKEYPNQLRDVIYEAIRISEAK